MLCQAKDDVRFYLCGVHIKGKHVEATNGHVAVRMTMESSVDEDLILSIKSKIPAAAVETVIVISDEPMAKHYDLFGSLCSISVIEVVEGKYPDIDKVIKDDKKAVDHAGISTGIRFLVP